MVFQVSDSGGKTHFEPFGYLFLLFGLLFFVEVRCGFCKPGIRSGNLVLRGNQIPEISFLLSLMGAAFSFQPRRIHIAILHSKHGCIAVKIQGILRTLLLPQAFFRHAAQNNVGKR